MQALKFDNNEYLDLKENGFGHFDVMSGFSFTSNTGKIVEVHKPFYTDNYSIPKVIRSIISNDDLPKWPSVMHDYSYFDGRYSRNDCDLLLKEALEFMNVELWKIKLVYYGVRIGGFIAYNKYRANDKLSPELREQLQRKYQRN